MLRELATLAVRPLSSALALPGTLLGGVSALSRAARDAEVAAVRVLDIVDRVEQLLDAVEPPAMRLADEVDVTLVSELAASARAVPGVVTSALDAVARFELFVTHAEQTRTATESLVLDVEALTQRTLGVLTAVEAAVTESTRVIDGAGAVVATADQLAGRIRELTAAVDGIVAEAASTAGAAQALAELVRPVIELAAGVGESAAGPIRVLMPVVEAQAPRVAELAPGLMDALRDLLANLPGVLRRVDEELMPTLTELRSTPEDVRALRDSVQEIEPLVEDVEAELAGLPGSRVLRRRGRRSDKEAEPEEG